MAEATSIVSLVESNFKVFWAVTSTLSECARISTLPLPANSFIPEFCTNRLIFSVTLASSDFADARCVLCPLTRLMC
ncbi:hypothetical protein LMG22037_06642 [Paraburkholderia phenoliruptrix]|uniref:Uncharacterized protein n=1 Tax=Paraburkholderia phenoliruptrix TaxID=252970 RepID=A0A6J5CS47_9BURK|nr:hypothetical protein LMG22037_06642 [Paraburkholderia phenoliruptrix]